MKRLGVVLIVLGIVAALVACFPGLAGEENPAPGFGTSQKIALAVGIVVLLAGVLMCSCGKCSCAAPTAAEPPAEEPESPAAEAPPEESSE